MIRKKLNMQTFKKYRKKRYKKYRNSETNK